MGLLFTIVLAMNGLYRGNIYEGLAIIKATNPDLWVVERYRGGPFNEQSSMSEYYHYSVKAVPGVEKACPFHLLYRGAADRRAKPAFQHHRLRRFRRVWAGPRRFWRAGASGQAHYEMVADKKLGVKLGDQMPLGLHTYTVVGLTQGSHRYQWGPPGFPFSARRPGSAVPEG